MPQVRRFYALPPTEVTDETTGEQITIPKYTDNENVSKANTASIPAPDNQLILDTLGVNAGDTIFLAMVRAEDTFLDDAEQNVGDIVRVTESATPAVSVTPDAAADYLNQKFRPQSLEELKEALGEEYADLSADQWAERLGLTTGF